MRISHGKQAIWALATLLATGCATEVVDDGTVVDNTKWVTFLDSGVPDVDPATLAKFSFFVTSMAGLQELSGREAGFGGDLRFGQTGAGAGLKGADRICATLAERSLPGASKKGWRAFLSATDDGAGNVVNAIDRIGSGPWYDRIGRVVSNTKADLLASRPVSADVAIRQDLPNEDGVPNHTPDPTQGEVDNHDMLTGTGPAGKLFASDATCRDWTTATGSSSEGQPRLGHAFPREDGGGGRGGEDSSHWMSTHDAPGCGRGINIADTGGAPRGSVSVGGAGGYGGFYCFALMP